MYTCQEGISAFGLNMEKLSSLNPEGAPAEKGKKHFNPFLESGKEAPHPPFVS